MEQFIGTNILRRKDAMAYLGIRSQSTFDSLRRSDETFPRPIALGARAVGFYRSELDAWLASRPRVGYAGERIAEAA